MSAHHIELFIQTILAVEDAYVNSAASMERRLCLVERPVSSLNALGAMLIQCFGLKFCHMGFSMQQQTH